MMTETPLCTVCIANYNGEEYLASCIDSVLGQDANFSIEIIVHDDASSDRSVELLREEYPQVRVIASEENVGFCVSNNRMVEVAKGEYILLLNNDAQLYSDALSTLIESHNTYGKGIYGLPQYNMDTGELIDIGSLFDPFLNPIPNNDPNRQDVGMIIGACLFISKELWDELEGFPTWFGSLAEDMYLCCVARLGGYQVKAISHSGFAHWVGRSLGGGKVTRGRSLSTTFDRRGMSERNKSFVMIICYPFIMACFLIPLHFFVLCLEGGVLTMLTGEKRFWVKIYWRCFREVWGHRNILFEKRRIVQQQQQNRNGTLQFLRVFSVIPHKIRMSFRYGVPEVK